MAEILISSTMFLAIVASLTFMILVAKKYLVTSGEITIDINDHEKIIKAQSGGKLLQTLSNNGIFLASACGGKGSCNQCDCIITEGGGEFLPIEKQAFTKKELAQNKRLSCQVAVKNDLKIVVKPCVLGVEEWECEVISNRNVATFIKELILKLPEGKNIDFKAGGYVQFEIPPYNLSFKNFDICSPFKKDWEKCDLFNLNVKTTQPTIRAYSMANYPAEKGILKFNIRIATPPAGKNVPSGAMSSYLFNLKPSDKLKTFGPFGEFFVQPTETEMVYIGGGAGMAPLRAQIFDVLKTHKSNRKISFWYGARSKKEMFYIDDFNQLQEEFPNFSWHVALSEPLPEDNWQGLTGFIHNVLYDQYLSKHKRPEDCEYYMCGPGVMADCVVKMLDNLGVEKSNIYFDDFGI